MSAAGMFALIRDDEEKAVVSGVPFHRMTDVGMNPDPLAARMTAEPAKIEVGAIELSTGVGLTTLNCTVFEKKLIVGVSFTRTLCAPTAWTSEALTVAVS